MAVVVLLAGCQSSPTSTADVSSNPAGTAAADPNAPVISYAVTQGQVNWVGKKAVGDQHIGTINVAQGSIETKGNNITGGSVVIDMTTIENNDLDGEMKEKLEGHLRSEDFFHVEQHPQATFTISGAKQVTNVPSVTHEINGDLTIKDITHPVSIQANISFIGDKVLVATPSFSIDRTKWDVKFGSGIVGTVADRIINDDIFLVVSLDGKQ